MRFNTIMKFISFKQLKVTLEAAFPASLFLLILERNMKAVLKDSSYAD